MATGFGLILKTPCYDENVKKLKEGYEKFSNHFNNPCRDAGIFI